MGVVDRAREIVGTGPFLLREYQPGQRLVFDRNPRYWRKAANGDALPYIDRLVLELVPDQNAELLRLQSGATDLTHSELRSDDYIPVRRAEEEGKLTMVELGVSPDADAFWFCLKPEKKARDPRFAFVGKREFRQAISHAVDREAFAQTVFLGEAVPIWGPITSGNRLWFSPNVPRYPFDVARARQLLESIGLQDRNGNGVVEDKAGTEARFTVITQQGIGYYERGTTVLREQAAAVGIALTSFRSSSLRWSRDCLHAITTRSTCVRSRPISIRRATWITGSVPDPRISGTCSRRRRDGLGAAHRHADA